MQSMGDILRELNPNVTLASEVTGKQTCEGCGNEVLMIQTPIIGGPDKGKLITTKRGCICWENEQARLAKIEQQKSKVKQYVEKYSTVNPDLENATFESFDPSTGNQVEALKLAMEYVQQFSLSDPKNLLFAGLYGLGKSHLSYSICKALREKGFVAVFISVPKLLTIIRSSYNKSSNVTEGDLLDVLSKVDFLALDDIGAERSKRDEDGESWAAEKIFEIIDGRSGRSTIYTTNLTAEELARKVGERNFSRMMMNTKPFKFEGVDYRINNKMF